jgi:transcriptional regulator with XRE-family HTH domain
MFAKELTAFKKRHNIKSADEWAKVSGVSKSTITRALNGDGKDMGVNTLLDLITPYGETLDQALEQGEYSPDQIKKEEIAEKIENVIEELENSQAIPEEPAEEIKNTLEEVQQFINDTSSTAKECPACAVLREMVANLNEEKDTKNKWIMNSFKICIILLLILFSMIVIDGILIMSIINMLN